MLRKTLWSTSATLSRALLGLTLNKIAAITGGPSAVVMLGNFLSLFAMGNSLGTAGTNNGVIKYLAEYRDVSQRARLIATAAIMAMAASATLGLGSWLARAELAQWLFFSQEQAWAIGTFSALLGFMAGHQLALASLNGLGRIRDYALLSISADFAAIGITLSLSPWLGWSAAMVGAMAAPAVVFSLLVLYLATRQKDRKHKLALRFDRREALRLGGYSLMLVTSLVATPLNQMFIRSHLVSTLGSERAGLWQGLWYFSDSYIALITSTLAVVLLPRLSALPSGLSLIAELRNVYKAVIPAALALSGVLFLARDFIITLLFSQDFLAMRELFAVQLVGGVVRIISWVLGFLLVARAMIGAVVFSEVFFNVSLYGLSVVFVDSHGLEGMPIAYTLNYVAYLVFLVAYLYWRSKTSPNT